MDPKQEQNALFNLLNVCVSVDTLAAAKARTQSGQGGLFHIKQDIIDSDGLRTSCESCLKFLKAIIEGGLRSFRKAPMRAALVKFNKNHDCNLFAMREIKLEDWSVRQMLNHVRYTSQRSTDCSRLPPAIRTLVASWRNQPCGGVLAIPIASLETMEIGPTRRLGRKTSEEEAYSPMPRKFCKTEASISRSPAGEGLPSVLKSGFGFGFPSSVSKNNSSRPKLAQQVCSGHGTAAAAEDDPDDEDMEDASEEEEELADPFVFENSVLPPGVKIYFDYAANCPMMLHPSGAISNGEQANGPGGFQIWKWPDGIQVESEIANILPVGQMKKPAACMKKPAAGSCASTEIDTDGDEGEAEWDVTDTPFIIPGRKSGSTGSKGPQLPTQFLDAKSNASCKASAKAKSVPAPEMPCKKVAAKDQAEVIGTPHGSAVSHEAWYLGKVEAYTQQSYIRFWTDEAPNKKLLIACSLRQSEKHQQVMEQLHALAEKHHGKKMSVHDVKFHLLEARAEILK